MSLPVLAVAQTASAPPATAPSRPAVVAPAAGSAYLTGDQRVRSSKIVGASVYNDKDEKIGTVDDVLISQGKEVSGIVLSVGGIFGLAGKLVEVPYGQLQLVNDRLVMAGASKDQFEHMPDYKYSPG